MDIPAIEVLATRDDVEKVGGICRDEGEGRRRTLGGLGWAGGADGGPFVVSAIVWAVVGERTI